VLFEQLASMPLAHCVAEKLDQLFGSYAAQPPLRQRNASVWKAENTASPKKIGDSCDTPKADPVLQN
jgi:hypothetical protein